MKVIYVIPAALFLATALQFFMLRNLSASHRYEIDLLRTQANASGTVPKKKDEEMKGIEARKKEIQQEEQTGKAVFFVLLAGTALSVWFVISKKKITPDKSLL